MYTTLVDAATLQRLLGRPDGLVVDCRFSLADVDYGRRAYAAGHIPGAHYLHLDHDLSSPITPRSGRHPLPEVAALAARLNGLGLAPEVQVVAYDDCGGAMAVRLWWLLRWLGHRQVALLDGGFPAWLAAGGAVEQTVPAARPGRFEPRQQPGFIADTAEIVAALASRAPEPPGDASALLLVDARTAERFRGEREPIDPVAGRIPGALNRPLGDNLVGGCFKSPEQLRAEWTAVLAGAASSPLPAAGPDEVSADVAPTDTGRSSAAAAATLAPGSDLRHIVHYCGSGVTAVHNQLAMEIAGLTGSRLYPGSWSEWIRDPDRPVKVGA